jgi:hypothetical protein
VWVGVRQCASVCDSATVIYSVSIRGKSVSKVEMLQGVSKLVNAGKAECVALAVTEVF